LTVEPEKTPFWRKEITFRRKSKGQALKALLAEPPRPESVADLLRPVAESVLEPDPETVRQAELSSRRDAMRRERRRREKAQKKAAKLADKARREVAKEVERAENEARRIVAALPDLEPEPLPAIPEPEPAATGEPQLSKKGEEKLERAERKRLQEVKQRERKEQRALKQEERKARKTMTRAEQKERKELERAEKEERKRRQRLEREELKQAPKPKELSHDKRHAKLVGLKVGASQIAAAEVINNGGARLGRFARAELPPGVVVGGELRDPEELAKALKEFFRDNKLPRSHVRLGISNNRIGMRIFDLTGIDDPKQLGNAIRFRAQETLPIPLDEAVLDYRILREDVDRDGMRIHRVLLVVAHKALVESYVAACRKAGVKLVGIDLEAFALLRAVGPNADAIAGDDAGAVVVSIGHDRSTLAVSDGAVCEFARVLPWGGAVLNSAIATALEIEEDEAEQIKHSVSLDPTVQSPVELPHDTLSAARTAMQAELQSFSRDLVASLRFYQEQPGSLGIGEIVLTGGCSHLPGLDTELQRLIGVRVRIGDPLERVKPARKGRKEIPTGSLAAAIGLGIED
jgi:type IV pilus assembly protein PilM